MANDDFRRDLNRVFDGMSGSPSSNLRDRVRGRLADAPRRRDPYWLAGVAAVVMAALVVGVLYVANPFRAPRNLAGGGPTPTPSAQPSPAPTPSATPSAQPFACIDQAFVSAGAGTPPPLDYVSALRTGTHTGYDRLTIEFAQGVPTPIETRYVTGTTYTLSPSGMRTTLKGQNSVLLILHGADMHTSYSGPTDIVTGYSGLAEVKRIEDFEGTVQLAVGINGAACYRAFFLTNPNRLVIDVENG
jgi:AMIN domain